ncbi:MAG: WD40 repeat domain-containing protein, partial [Balneolaceae bacterium]
EELLFEKSVTFDPAIFFRPTIDLDILSEKRWAFTFQNVPFFAEKITVFRVGGYQQRDVEFELSPTETSFVDSLILGSVESNNQFREYNVTVSDEFNAGIATNFRRFFKISHPRLSIQNPTSIVDEVTFQISPSTNPESQNDLIEEYVIERSDLITGSTRFRAIGRVKPNESGEATFTDILSSPSRKRYLVRTATSGPSNLITLELDNSLDIQVHGAGDKPVYHIESTPDNGFLAFILTVENTSYNALMAINNNTFFASSVSSSQDLTVRSFSLSGTGNTVYIALEERNSVLRTGFPNNSSPLEIIKPDPDDYVLSSIAVSPDESFLFATDPSGSVKRWNLLNFQEDFHVDPAQPATNTRTNIAVSPNGAYVVVGGAQTTVLDADTGALLTTLSGICTGNFTFNDASTYFSCFNENTNQPLLFNTSNWQQHSFQNLTMQAGTFQAHTIHPTRPESILFTDTNRILFHDYEKNETINILDPMNLFRDNNATTIHWLSDDRITIGTDSGLVFNIVVLENRWRRVIN